jgi:hypothetical protein
MLIFSSVPCGIWQLIGLVAGIVFIVLDYCRAKGTQVSLQKTTKTTKLVVIPETRRYSK